MYSYTHAHIIILNYLFAIEVKIILSLKIDNNFLQHYYLLAERDYRFTCTFEFLEHGIYYDIILQYGNGFLLRNYLNPLFDGNQLKSSYDSHLLLSLPRAICNVIINIIMACLFQIFCISLYL